MRRHLAVIAVTLVATACHAPAPSRPSVDRTVTVSHGTVAFVPTTPAGLQLQLETELSDFLRTLYTEGFVRAKPKGPTPAPDDAPLRRIEPLFAPGARSKLDTSNVFVLGPHLDLLTGHVAYNGGITRDGSIRSALIALSFTGTGSRTDETTPVVSFTQSGTMTLQRTETGWVVRAFDLKIAVQPPPPTPTPT